MNKTKMLSPPTDETKYPGALPQHPYFRNRELYSNSIMYFILYNFVQRKLNFVQPINPSKFQFHLTVDGVTLPQHPD